MQATSLSFAGWDHQALCARLTALAHAERAFKLEFLRALGELDERRLYLELGFSSTHGWLVEHLKLSNASAFRRVTAARLLRRIPLLSGYLESGQLSLTKLSHLRDVLTVQNAPHLLEWAARLTEREVECLATSLDPNGRARIPKDSIRPLMLAPASPASTSTAAAPASISSGGNQTAPSITAASQVASSGGNEPARAPALTPPAPPTPAPTPPPVLHQIKMTVGPEFLERL